MASTRFDERLAQVLAEIRASGRGIEDWVDPVLGMEARTPEEEQQKTGMLVTIGSMLGAPKRGVDFMANYYANPSLRNKVLLGGEPVPIGTLAKETYIGPPEAHQSPAEQHLRAAGRGLVERWIDVSTDPVLWGVGATMHAPGLVPGVVKVGAALGFTAAMAKDLVHQADATYQSYKREGWSPTTSEEAAKGAFDVGMLATMIPRRAKPGPPAPPPPPPEEGWTWGEGAPGQPPGRATRARRTPPPAPGELPPGDFEGAFEGAYGRAQEDFLRGRPRLLPPEAETGRPAPEPPPTGPGRPPIREANVPDTPERMADNALLGQITEIQREIQSRLEGGDVDGAQELRRHFERLQDVYRTRRYAPGMQVGRAADLMQLRDQLRVELRGRPESGRALEIREALSVLDAEIEVAGRTARGAPATVETPEPAPAGVPPAPPPEPGVAAPAAPPGPLPSRAPRVTLGERGPAVGAATPVQGALEGVAEARQPTQELVERAQAEAAGLPPPASGPLATVLEGGEPAGAAARLTEPAAPPAPLPGMPGGPVLDVRLAPAGAPRLAPRGPGATVVPQPQAERTTGPDETLPLAAKVPGPDETVRLERGPDETMAPAPARVPSPDETQRLPAVEARKEPPAEGEQMGIAEAALEATVAAPPPEAPVGPVRQAMETYPNPTRGLSSEQARKKAGDAQVGWLEIGGKPFFVTRHLTARGKVALQGPRDVAMPQYGVSIEKLASAMTAPARPVGWQVGADPKYQPVWFEAQGRKGPTWAAMAGEYFRTLNRLAQQNKGSEWRMAPPKKGAPKAIGVFDAKGKLLGLAAPLNETGPPPPLKGEAPGRPAAEAFKRVEPTPEMRAAFGEFGEVVSPEVRAGTERVRELDRIEKEIARNAPPPAEPEKLPGPDETIPAEPLTTLSDERLKALAEKGAQSERVLRERMEEGETIEGEFDAERLEGAVRELAPLPESGAAGPPAAEGWAERVEAAKARNRKRGTQMNIGVDPLQMRDIAIEGADLVARGFRRFSEWSGEMLRTFGEGVRGLLRSLWDGIRGMFGAGERPVAPGGPQEAQTLPPGPRGGPRPGFEEYRAAYEAATNAPRGAPRRRYPWEATEIPPEEVRAAAEDAAKIGQEPAPEYGKPSPEKGEPRAPINFDRVGGEPEIREWQARYVEAAKERLGKVRSYRSWEEARQDFLRSGHDEQDFIRMVKARGVVTDADVEGGRTMREGAAQHAVDKLGRLKELKEQRRTATDEQAQRRLDGEILEADRDYRNATARYGAITAATVESGAELARALAIMRKMTESVSPEESFFKQLLRKHPGLSEKLQTELADAVLKKDAKKLRDIARQLYKPGPLEYATEWFTNSLLSGLQTFEVNLLGNVFFEGAVRTPERGLAAGIEATGARQWVEKMFGKNPLPRERFGREFEEAVRSHYHTKFGVLKSFKYAWEYLLEEPGVTGVKGEFRPQAFTGTLGKVIRTPSRTMWALDLGSRWAAMEAEAAVQAVRRAITESRTAGGWTREQVTTRMRDLQQGYRRFADLEARRTSGQVLAKEDYRFLQQNPMYGRWQAAIKQAGAKATLTDHVSRFAGALLQMREAHPWITFFAPFISFSDRALAAALERSPYGAYDTIKKARAGGLKGGELSDAMARVVWGNMLGASFYLLARAGLVTGSGPSDPRERAVLRKTGWEPYAAKLGDTYFSMARLDPLSTTLGWAADLAEAKDVRGAGEAYDKLIQSISLNIANKTYLQGVTGLAEAVADPERYGAQLGRKTLGAFIPNLLAQAARAIDPTVRETDTVAGTLLSRVPLLSETLPPRRTGTGEELKREEHPLSLWINPFRYSVEKGPEANLERIFLDVGYIPSNAPKTLTIPGTSGRKVALTGEERQLYSDFKERATAYARTLAQNEQFLGLEPFMQEEFLKRIYRYSHDAAHKAMLASVMKRAAGVEWVK